MTRYVHVYSHTRHRVAGVESHCVVFLSAWFNQKKGQTRETLALLCLSDGLLRTLEGFIFYFQLFSFALYRLKWKQGECNRWQSPPGVFCEALRTVDQICIFSFFFVRVVSSIVLHHQFASRFFPLFFQKNYILCGNESSMRGSCEESDANGALSCPMIQHRKLQLVPHLLLPPAPFIHCGSKVALNPFQVFFFNEKNLNNLFYFEEIFDLKQPPLSLVFSKASESPPL